MHSLLGADFVGCSLGLALPSHDLPTAFPLPFLFPLPFTAFPRIFNSLFTAARYVDDTQGGRLKVKPPAPGQQDGILDG